ncbi:MAG: Stk1 family PASTA domain-containing Ser/Thr kinase [Oscillospiraceae bacterium]
MDNYIGKKLDGRYELLELIGVGGMANVYKARDNLEDRIVAVKILREEFLDNEELVRRFKNESKAIGLLSHPNIVKVFDVNFSDVVQYIVMEFIDGITLKEYIDRSKPLSWKDTVHFTVQILRALQHAHDRGIVHRDIKPQNIMLLADGSIKVMDFGIARFSRSETRTITDKTIGSVHYISPEQAKGDITDAKADLYSVGIMMYEMLTGKLPFDSDSAVSVAIKQISDNAKRPRDIVPEIPEALEEITLKAMAKNSSMRYQSASQMLRDIDDFKKNPSIVFAYKYFTDDASPTKYIDKTVKPVKKKKEKGSRKKGSLSIALMLGITAACVVSTAALLFFAFGLFQSESLDTDLPNFVGKTWAGIQSTPEYKNFKFIATEEFNNDFPVGTVFDQSPLPPKKIKESGEVTLYISKGTQTVTIPDIVGMSSGEAKTTLRSLDLAVRQESVSEEAFETNKVVNVSPVVGSEVESGSTVTIYVNTLTMSSTVTVPKLIGLLHFNASTTITSFGLKKGAVTVVESSEPAGTVIKQSIEPGALVPTNTVIDLEVSSGEVPANGIIISSKTATVEVGKTVTLTATITPENASNKGVDWKSSDPTKATVAGGVVTGVATGSVTISANNHRGDTVSCTVTVTHAAPPPVKQYSITATSADANGTLSPAGSSLVGSSQSLVYTITPNAGFAVADVLVDGASVGAVTTYTFSNVQSDHTISASFKATS